MPDLQGRMIHEVAELRARLARLEAAIELTPIGTLDARYVNVTGDTMTGLLEISREGDGVPGLFVTVYDTSGAAAASQIIVRSARGTNASPSALKNGDILMGQVGRGYGATGFSSGARAGVAAYAAEDWTDAAQGSYIIFIVTPTGTATPGEIMRIQNNGNVGFATNAPAGRVHINGTADDEQLIVEGHSTQNSNLQEWRNSSGTVFSRVNGAGEIIARLDVVTKTTTYTATVNDHVILCDASGGAWTLSLPTASPSGQQFHIKKIDSSTNAVTVDGNGSQTIDGSTTALLSAQYDAIHIVSDGSNWYIL
jgi:hypothetical protein